VGFRQCQLARGRKPGSLHFADSGRDDTRKRLCPPRNKRRRDCLERDALVELLRGDNGKPKAPDPDTGCRGQPLPEPIWRLV
jgi:hypothetical protein